MNGRTHALEGGKVVLGRSKDCDIRVEDANVSRRHAELRREGADWWLVDLDSTNGTELNGRRVSRSKLSDGDTITLGAAELVVRKDADAVNIAVDEALLVAQGRLHRPALPLHLADRAQRQPRLRRRRRARRARA